jgi:hypothetical protein
LFLERGDRLLGGGHFAISKTRFAWLAARRSVIAMTLADRPPLRAWLRARRRHQQTHSWLLSLEEHGDEIDFVDAFGRPLFEIACVDVVRRFFEK